MMVIKLFARVACFRLFHITLFFLFFFGNGDLLFLANLKTAEGWVAFIPEHVQRWDKTLQKPFIPPEGPEKIWWSNLLSRWWFGDLWPYVQLAETAITVESHLQNCFGFCRCVSARHRWSWHWHIEGQSYQYCCVCLPTTKHLNSVCEATNAESLVVICFVEYLQPSSCYCTCK